MITNINNAQYTVNSTENNKADIIDENTDLVNLNEEKKSEEQVKPKFDEKVMMDLQDVQNFLFMMIGSEIRIKSDENYNSNINFVA